jgi:hypothetical protein
MSPVAPVIAIALLIVVVAGVVRLATLPTIPDFRHFGTVETRFGTAGVVCGGEVTRCDESTALAFAACTRAVKAYFGGSGSFVPGVGDERVRALLGARPPAGDYWSYTCGRPQLVRGAPAQLKSN